MGKEGFSFSISDTTLSVVFTIKSFILKFNLCDKKEKRVHKLCNNNPPPGLNVPQSRRESIFSIQRVHAGVRQWSASLKTHWTPSRKASVLSD